ncbi:MAG: hypothetical protein FJ317_01290, partial [SAR202 cluster bacterium]|nr:hypothetical protein [SAR202 cluster bacterium]
MQKLNTTKKKASQLEESLALRLVVLALAWWVDLSLAWVGAPVWVWVSGLLAVTMGHFFSWRMKNWSSPLRATLIALGLVGVLFVMRGAILQVPTGNFMPVAHLLVLLQGAASFELRSRGGLHASLALSGLIFFFASQAALGEGFFVFVAGFSILFLGFFAVSFVKDRLRRADVSWFPSRRTSTGLWTSVGAATILAAVVAFLLVPKGVGAQLTHTQASVVPLRGTGLEMAQQSPTEEEQGATEGGEQEVTASGGTGENGSQEGSNQNGSSPGRFEVGQERGEGAAAEEVVPEARADVIMNVRSSVLSYWRGQVFDTYQGGTWMRDTSYDFDRFRIFRDQGSQLRGKTVYTQTYYLHFEPGPREVFSGYDPIAISSASRGEEGGPTIYRVHSVLPDYSPEILGGATPSVNLNLRYHRRLGSSAEHLALAERVIEGALTDLERAQRISAYLRETYDDDPGAEDQGAATMTLDEFFTSTEPRTSMDFATAAVHLARLAGMPARLVAGYLPGQYDPLSGTYMVTKAERHAWMEVYLQGVGWVPFDGSPRPEVAALAEGTNTYARRWVGGLFQTSYGEDAFQAIRSSPQQIADAIQQGFATVVGAALVVAVLAVAAVGLALLFMRLRRRSVKRRKAARAGYASLDGQTRAEMLRLYSDAQSALSRRGLPGRASWQTPAEYEQAVRAQMADAGGDLSWLTRAATSAAYDPAPFPDDLVAEA